MNHLRGHRLLSSDSSHCAGAVTILHRSSFPPWLSSTAEWCIGTMIPECNSTWLIQHLPYFGGSASCTYQRVNQTSRDRLTSTSRTSAFNDIAVVAQGSVMARQAHQLVSRTSRVHDSSGSRLSVRQRSTLLQPSSPPCREAPLHSFSSALACTHPCRSLV